MMDDEEIHDYCTECNTRLWSRESAIRGICSDCVDEDDEQEFLDDLEERLERALDQGQAD